jgi:NADPH:quinone reductase-like Zn-dependent oxidoreductase
MRNRSDEYKTDVINKMKADCMSGFKDGSLWPIIDKAFKLSDIVEAHRYMETNSNIGKIVLNCDL